MPHVVARVRAAVLCALMAPLALGFVAALALLLMLAVAWEPEREI